MKTKKIMASIILIFIVATMVIPTISFADTYTPTQFKSKISTNATGTGNVKTVGGKIVGLIQVVGTIVAVGMLIVLGIKYMMGSAEERAEYKKTLFPYFIGAVLIFAATTIANVIYTWANAL